MLTMDAMGEVVVGSGCTLGDSACVRASWADSLAEAETASNFVVNTFFSRTAESQSYWTIGSVIWTHCADRC